MAICHADAETPRDGRRTVSVMAGNESPCLREADRPQFELPIQHGMAALAIADPAQAVAGQHLGTQPAQEIARPAGSSSMPAETLSSNGSQQVFS